MFDLIRVIPIDFYLLWTSFWHFCSFFHRLVFFLMINEVLKLQSRQGFLKMITKNWESGSTVVLLLYFLTTHSIKHAIYGFILDGFLLMSLINLVVFTSIYFNKSAVVLFTTGQCHYNSHQWISVALTVVAPSTVGTTIPKPLAIWHAFSGCIRLEIQIYSLEQIVKYKWSTSWKLESFKFII